MDEAHPPEDLETPPDDRPLIERIGDKNWKTRTAAYDDLKQLVGEAEAAPSLFTEFASWLPKMTADSNAGALDAGIDAAAAFVASAPVELLRPYCEKLVANAADKAFSGRASTISRGKALCHKLSEVDTPGPVALYLLTRLGDKKPKIPPTCLELLREGVEAFGVKAYPVREILKALPAVFNGSNSAARDAAMALLVELHRWLRRPPLQQLLDGLRTAQQSDFDKAVAEQETGAAAPVPSLYLRTSRPKEGEAPTPAPVAAPAAANDGAVDGREYADEVDLMKRLKTSEYGSLVADEKWSEQLRAMQIVIDAIGPVPKIKPGCDVGDLMSVIKGFLRQGHLQLQTASLKVIGLLADGLRREFGNSVRPLLQQVVGKSREKRLVPEVQGALLAVFTHCVPLDCINDDLIEFLASKKSPPHGRVCLLEVVLQVCGTLPEKVGSDMLKPLALALLEESEDSDPKVREAVVQALGGVAKLAKSRGRLAAGAYKAVLGAEASRPKVFKKIQAYMAGGEVPETRPSTLSSTMSSKKPSAAPSVLPSASTVSKKVPAASVSRKEAPPASASTTASASAEDDNVEELCLGEWEAEQALEAMGVPGWDKVKASLGKDAGWAEKVEALAALEKRCVELGEQGGCGQYSAALVAYLSASCGGFKISNVNILKAVMATCCAAAKHSTGEGQRFSRAAAWELIKQFVDKLGDKKAKEGVLGLLSALAESLGPSFVLRRGRQVLEKTPSPLAHQHLLEWLKQAVTDFGVAALPVPMCASFCLGEMDNKAAAVRGAAVEALGALYNQLGPRFSALALPSSLKPAVRVLLEAEFAKVGHDPAAPAPKAGAGAAGGAASSGGGGGGGVPRQDLCSLLPKDVVSELGYLEGKTSWIRRKAAMEAVVAACERAAHFLEANRPTGEVLKALKPRVAPPSPPPWPPPPHR
ncbi:armadillo-type protein [Ochromonadaceae sp. CCMP2298]|nr:armadillo-type protein [Ochromonadaceae sp. CCMP2298]